MQVDLLIVIVFGFIDGGKVVGFCQMLDIVQFGIVVDWVSFFVYQFYVVIIYWVMVGSNFDVVIYVEMECGEINFFGVGYVNIQYIDVCIL